MEFTVWMETVTSFDHFLWLASFHNFSLQDLHHWEIVVNQIKVLESVTFAYDLLVDFREVLGSFSGKPSDSFVGVEPSPARTDLEAVQEVINISVSDVQWMSPVMQVIIQQTTIGQSQDHQVATSRYSGVQVVQKLQDIFLEMYFSGHAVERFGTDIVSNKFQEHNQRVIILLFSAQGMNVSPGVSTVASVYSDVLIIVVVAQIPLSGVLVETVASVSVGWSVACVP